MSRLAVTTLPPRPAASSVTICSTSAASVIRETRIPMISTRSNALDVIDQSPSEPSPTGAHQFCPCQFPSHLKRYRQRQPISAETSAPTKHIRHRTGGEKEGSQSFHV